MMRVLFLCLICLGVGMLVSCDQADQSSYLGYKRLHDDEEGGFVVHSFTNDDASVKIQTPVELGIGPSEGSSDGNWSFDLSDHKKPDDFVSLHVFVPENSVKIVQSSGAYVGASLEQTGDLWILKKNPGNAQ